MERQKIVVLSLVLFCSLVVAGIVWADGVPTIPWSVIGGGGGHLEVAPYILDGTIGQPVVGWVSNLPYELCAGYWCGAVIPYRVYLPLVLRNY